LASLKVDINEKDLEELLYEVLKERPLELIEQGFPIAENFELARQLNLGKYGRADLVASAEYQGELFIFIYELKARTGHLEHLEQLSKYMGGIYDWLIDQTGGQVDLDKVNIEGFLVAADFDIPLCGWLAGNIKFVEWSVDHIKGLVFEYNRFKYYSNQSPGKVKLELPILPLKEQ